jgi:hypothetical protein
MCFFYFKKNIKELKKRVSLIMPPFRIHQTRSRPERILIRLMQGRFIIPSVQPVPVQANPSVPSVVPEEKKKTTISLKQIRDIILLLQKSEHKNLDKLLPPDLKSLLTLDEDKVDDVDESEDLPELPEDDEDDILIIDV